MDSLDIDGAEISWFAPLCDGDDDFLGNRNPAYKSSWENTSEIVKTADDLGFRNVLCPSSYQVGQDTLSFVAGMAPLTKQINLLAAIRCGEIHPPMLARSIATIDHMLKGRLTINIISSDLPGDQLSSSERYSRSREVIKILKQAWSEDYIDFEGNYYKFKLSSKPVKTYQKGGPLLYFGGYSPDGVALCAEHCDVYLMWPETKNKIKGLMDKMTEKAATYNRKVQFGLRVHVIVRKTEKEAREYAKSLLSKLELDLGKDIRNRSQDYNSLLWVIQQLFEDVQAVKPNSSRAQSAEIFLVCMKYTAPNHIDPKLLGRYSCISVYIIASLYFLTSNVNFTLILTLIR